jgi:hypothetical protein
MKVDPTNYTRLLRALYLQALGTNGAIASAAAMAQPSAPLAAPKPGEGGATRPGAASNRPGVPDKGGELLVGATSRGNLDHETAIPSAPTSSSQKPSVAIPAPKPAPTAAAAKKTVAANASAAAVEPSQDQMEASLLATIQVTPDDLQELMQARARSVQAALVNVGKVEGERVAILAPQPISLAAQGQSRATLSLQ